jgi:hypothetical protein
MPQLHLCSKKVKDRPGDMPVIKYRHPEDSSLKHPNGDPKFTEDEIWEINDMVPTPLNPICKTDYYFDDFEGYGWTSHDAFWDDIRNIYYFTPIHYYTDTYMPYPFSLIKIAEFLERKSYLNPNHQTLVDCGIYAFI